MLVFSFYQQLSYLSKKSLMNGASFAFPLQFANEKALCLRPREIMHLL